MQRSDSCSLSNVGLIGLEQFGRLGVGALQSRGHDKRCGWRGVTEIDVLASTSHAVDNTTPTARRPVTVVVIVVGCRGAERGATVV